MNRTRNKIFSAAATAASTAFLASTVATSTATAATFHYTGANKFWSASGLAITSPEASSVSELTGVLVGGGSGVEVEFEEVDVEFYVSSGVFFGYYGIEFEEWVSINEWFGSVKMSYGSRVVVQQSGRRFEFGAGEVHGDLYWSELVESGGGSDEDTVTVPEPSSAIALGALALGALATKLRRRS